MLKVGDKAPEFCLPDQSGKDQELADYHGQWILLYFYPKDNTPGCTKEACGIRDSWSAFKKLGVAVLGVSADSSQSHTKFSEKYTLPFTLLADTEKTVIAKYGAEGLFKRVSYLIDPDGNIAKVYEKVKPEEHAEEVIADLKELM